MGFEMHLWGNLGCFSTTPVERATGPCPSPGQSRGMLHNIFGKPNECYYQIDRIEIVCNPNNITNVVKTEFKDILKVDKALEKRDYESNLTQRATSYIINPEYYISFRLIPREGFDFNSLREQFLRRVLRGGYFRKPVFGLSNCPVSYELITDNKTKKKPFDFSSKFLMRYDMFDYTKYSEQRLYRTYFNADIKNGVLLVPEFNSPEVLKPK